jgi:chromosome partitioning protein
VRAVLTRYDGTQQAEMAALMQAYMGGSLSPWRQDFTALIGQAGEQIAGIYEADYRDFNRETYARGRAAFDETYAGFKRLLIGAWHRDVAARRCGICGSGGGIGQGRETWPNANDCRRRFFLPIWARNRC